MSHSNKKQTKQHRLTKARKDKQLFIKRAFLTVGGRQHGKATNFDMQQLRFNRDDIDTLMLALGLER